MLSKGAMWVCSPVCDYYYIYANVPTYIDYIENMNILEFITIVQTLYRVYRVMFLMHIHYTKIVNFIISTRIRNIIEEKLWMDSGWVACFFFADESQSNSKYQSSSLISVVPYTPTSMQYRGAHKVLMDMISGQGFDIQSSMVNYAICSPPPRRRISTR